MDKELSQFVESTLRKHALAEVKSSDKADSWWDNLPGKRKKKVVNVLGLSKGKDVSLFSKMSPGEQSEIEAYFVKHQGKVEGLDDEGNELDESTSYVNAQLALVKGKPVAIQVRGYDGGKTKWLNLSKEVLKGLQGLL